MDFKQQVKAIEFQPCKRHNKTFCCICRYGILHENNLPETDFYTEVNRKNGFSILAGFNMRNSNL